MAIDTSKIVEGVDVNDVEMQLKQSSEKLYEHHIFINSYTNSGSYAVAIAFTITNRTSTTMTLASLAQYMGDNNLTQTSGGIMCSGTYRPSTPVDYICMIYKIFKDDSNDNIYIGFLGTGLDDEGKYVGKASGSAAINNIKAFYDTVIEL